MKIDLFDFVIDARKLRRLLKDMYETGEINEYDYFLIEDKILLHCNLLVPDENVAEKVAV